MFMFKELFKINLEKKCNSIIEKYNRRRRNDAYKRNRFNKQVINYNHRAIKRKYNNVLWKLHPQFNPFKVKNSINFYTEKINHSVLTGKYEPITCVKIEISKKGGGTRDIVIYTVVDSALNNTVYTILNNKVEFLLPNNIYSFRKKINAHTAIYEIHNYLKENLLFYVGEFDLKSYYDNISHDYILSICNNKLNMTYNDMKLIESILNVKISAKDSYKDGFWYRNNKGIPQGNTLSLLLANIAFYEFDNYLINNNIFSSRFVDDILIISKNKKDIYLALDMLLKQCDNTGVNINMNKSHGLSIYTNNEWIESKILGKHLPVKHSYSFLAHDVSGCTIDLSQKRIKSIKNRVSKIIYDILIKYPKKYNSLNPNRYDSKLNIDWDLVSCYNKLRNYIYGRGISENYLINALKKDYKSYIKPYSALAFHPRVISNIRVKELDGWLVDVMYRGLKARKKYITNFTLPDYTKKELITGTWYNKKKRMPLWMYKIETRMPSFYKSLRYVRKYHKEEGDIAFPSPYSSS